MLVRVFAVAMNAYREAVRMRILYGLLAIALATAGYSLVLASLSLDQQARVVSDVGAASMSLYAVFVAVILGATSLHRELELKTVFPILTRPLRRHEYLIGKYTGTLATLLVFVCIDAAVVFAMLAGETGQSPGLVLGAAAGLLVVLAVLLYRAKYTRVFVVIPWAVSSALVMALIANTGGPNRTLVIASAILTLLESAIIAAVATLFSSFSSPFLTATFTVGVFLTGRSADTLARLPQRQFGAAIPAIGRGLSHVFPNLHVYVPPRPVLLGEVASLPLWPHVGRAALQSFAYSAVCLALAVLFFRRRDFT